MLVVDGVEVLDVREAASFARRTPETVRRWVWSGRLPARRQGNRLLVARGDLEALVRPPLAMSLRDWSALLPSGSGDTAAELVLTDRTQRSRSLRARR